MNEKSKNNIIWTVPKMFGAIEITDFPVLALPMPMANQVSASSESTQTPLEMGGLLALGVLSASLLGKYEVRVNSDWIEPMNLFVVAVAPPADRKSAVIKALTLPIYDYEVEITRRDASAIAINRAEKQMLIAAKEKAIRTGDLVGIKEAAAKLSIFQDMPDPRKMADDTTQEKGIDRMDSQGGKLVICSSEGGVFEMMSGRYDSKVNLDVYLKGHASDPIRVDRIGRKSNVIDKPNLAMIITVQPSVLDGLMKNPTFRGKGLCGRFLYAICNSKIGNRNVNPDPVPQEIKDKYHSFIYGLLQHEGGGYLTLSDKANDLRIRYAQYIEEHLNGKWKHMQDWAGKLCGAMLRIAGLLHIANNLGAMNTVIEACSIEQAIQISECLSQHAMLAYSVMGVNESANNAKYLWRKIAEANVPEITKRDLFQMCHGKYASVDDMQPALDTLVGMGYIHIYKDDKTGGRPSEIIMVNPLAKGTKGSKAQTSETFEAFDDIHQITEKGDKYND